MDDAARNASAKTSASNLYDEDFYAWTQEQAGLLRQGRVAQADLANILEEIETLGRKEVSELRSRYKVLLQHLLKDIYQPDRSGRSWKTTILNQRIEIARHIGDNPSLKARADGIFLEAYGDARKLAASETGIDIGVFPNVPPFTQEQALDQEWELGRDPVPPSESA